MDTLTLRYCLLVLHLAGLVLMAGTTVTEWVVFRTFIRLYRTKGKASAGLLQLLSSLGVLVLVGGVLLVLSGSGLMILTEGTYFHQFWFQLKLFLILLLPLNGMLLGGPQMEKLKKVLSHPVNDPGLATPKPVLDKLTLYHVLQMGVLLAIVLVAVFKPS